MYKPVAMVDRPSQPMKFKSELNIVTCQTIIKSLNQYNQKISGLHTYFCDRPGSVSVFNSVLIKNAGDKSLLKIGSFLFL